jgi:hypothetical protein
MELLRRIRSANIKDLRELVERHCADEKIDMEPFGIDELPADLQVILIRSLAVGIVVCRLRPEPWATPGPCPHAEPPPGGSTVTPPDCVELEELARRSVWEQDVRRELDKALKNPSSFFLMTTRTPAGSGFGLQQTVEALLNEARAMPPGVFKQEMFCRVAEGETNPVKEADKIRGNPADMPVLIDELPDEKEGE